jgi:ubiquinone/menaquinone biosynthesis C-methylase UbiE
MYANWQAYSSCRSFLLEENGDRDRTPGQSQGRRLPTETGVCIVMTTSPLFATGRREISAAAAEAARAAQIDPGAFFARHERGDWGEAPDWLQADNTRAALAESYSHAIRSHYRPEGAVEFLVITARDRTRTRLMLAREFSTRDVSVQEGYALWAATYDYTNPLVAVEEPVVDALLAALPPPASAMDVGTGTGRLARKLARLGAADVLGVDATPEMLRVARETARAEGLHNLRFALAVLGEIPLPAADASMDLLTCGLMLCHVPDLRGAIRECARVVRPGGWLLLTDFHPATAAFGWRTDLITPEGIHLLPNTPGTRQDYLDALIEAGCGLLSVQDIALDGAPYGDVSDSVVRAKGKPPLCLIVLAEKQPAA